MYFRWGSMCIDNFLGLCHLHSILYSLFDAIWGRYATYLQIRCYIPHPDVRYTNYLEMCLHITQGMSFDHIVERLRAGTAIWVAVGGAREMHPHIRKVHTGPVRIAMQCGDVWLVPIHLAFEAHCQVGTAVLVEVGEPWKIAREDPTSIHGREMVRALTKVLEERLLPLTNWMPVSQDDFGKKGWRGAGETRVAIVEWSKVRVIDSLICLQLVAQGRTIAWAERLGRVRQAVQRTMEHPKENGLEQTMLAFRDFAEAAARHGVKVFQPPTGTYWDVPVLLKAVPRTNPADTGGPWRLPALRNFSHGLHIYSSSALNREDDSGLNVAFRNLMEASKPLMALINSDETKRDQQP